MENQDIDLLGETVGKMFYKIGIVDKDGKLANQFVANASTNRVDIPQAVLGTSEVPQLPSTTNLFSGSAVGDILLSGPSANYDNVQDGLLITLSNQTLGNIIGNTTYHYDLSSIGLQPIKIPKEKLVVNSSFDVSDQLSQYVGKNVQAQSYDSHSNTWFNYGESTSYSIASFGGTTINVLPNTTLSMPLTMKVKADPSFFDDPNTYQIPVIQVNTYKN